MDFNNLEDIKNHGFVGFKKIKELREDNKILPKKKGVYLIIYAQSNKPEYLIKGSGGFFKDKDPGVSIDELKNNWVDNTRVIYIGKAGGNNSNATISSRLKQYLNFGLGKKVGHWGGRLIWQIKGSGDLLVCWKETLTEEPRNIESGLIEEFKIIYKKRPFANLTN